MNLLSFLTHSMYPNPLFDYYMNYINRKHSNIPVSISDSFHPRDNSYIKRKIEGKILHI